MRPEHEFGPSRSANPRAARQTASIVAVHAADENAAALSRRLLLARRHGKHKTSMSLKKLLACFASDMLHSLILSCVLIAQMSPFERDPR
jgi:hypothetical protein